jgi:parallel beta-helix repeat protein
MSRPSRVSLVVVGLLGVASLVPVSGASAAPAAVVQCGQFISADTTLTNDLLNCPGNGILIDTDNVTLDLGGHTVDGTGSGDGISILGTADVKVVNGVVRDFANGVQISEALGTTVENVTVMRSRGGAIGVVASENTLVRDNTINSGLTGISVLNGVTTQIEDNHIVSATSGIGVTTISSPGGGLPPNSSDVTIHGNHVVRSASDGIRIGPAVDEATVADNMAVGNGDDGIEVLSDGVTIASNTANSNGDLGIEAPATSVDGGANRAHGNGDARQCVGVRCN